MSVPQGVIFAGRTIDTFRIVRFSPAFFRVHWQNTHSSLDGSSSNHLDSSGILSSCVACLLIRQSVNSSPDDSVFVRSLSDFLHL